MQRLVLKYPYHNHSMKRSSSAPRLRANKRTSLLVSFWSKTYTPNMSPSKPVSHWTGS